MKSSEIKFADPNLNIAVLYYNEEYYAPFLPTCTRSRKAAYSNATLGGYIKSHTKNYKNDNDLTNGSWRFVWTDPRKVNTTMVDIIRLQQEQEALVAKRKAERVAKAHANRQRFFDETGMSLGRALRALGQDVDGNRKYMVQALLQGETGCVYMTLDNLINLIETVKERANAAQGA